MVGVKGKYKGCNTCRGRRVKCDNSRPFCRNCIDHGRACEGYERETVFIVGTIDDKGRCASHPPRNLAGPVAKQKKRKTARLRDQASSSPSPGGAPPPSPTPASTEGPVVPEARDLAPVEPWVPAWSDDMTLGSPRGGGLCRVRFLALRTRLGAVVATAASEGGDAPPHGVRPTLPPSCRASEQPRFDGPERFRLASQCFLRVPRREAEAQAGRDHPGPPGVAEEGSCLFLYEQNFSAVYNHNPPWEAPTVPEDDILARGPAMFQTFPAHHFFARVYRPIAILTTLLTRTPSPLAAPEWAAVPYARHPPTLLDALLDTVARVPGLLARADRLGPRRRLEASDLLAHGAAVEGQLAAWYAQLERAAAANRAMPLLYWTAGSVGLFAWAGGPAHPPATRRREAAADAAVHVPFTDTYEFASTVVGLGHVVYWTALMTLYECMDRLVPVVLGRSEDGMTVPGRALDGGDGSRSSTVRDAASSGLPGLPPSCRPARYQARERRKLAANICRSLDWVIGPSGLEPFSSAHSPPPALPSAAPSSSVSSSSFSSRLSAPRLSSSLPSPSTSSSSFPSWISSPPPLPGAAGSVAALPSPQPDLAMTRSSQLGSVGSEPRDDAQGHDPRPHPPPHCGGGSGAGAGHPDLAAIPLWALERFYDGLGADAALERAWCRGFRSRLEAVGRAADGGVGGGWREVARFG